MAVLKSRSEAVVPTYLGWIGTYALLIAIIVACDAFGLLQQQGVSVQTRRVSECISQIAPAHKSSKCYRTASREGP